MVKLVKPSPADKVAVGKNPNNKPAEAYEARGAKDKLKYTEGKDVINELNPSAGTVNKGNFKPIKTDGIKMRGTGAATKGLMSRGPMA